MIKLNGTIRNNGVTDVLVIHSKNLSNEIRKLNRRVELKDFKDGALIKPNGDTLATIVRNKRIQIAINKLIMNKMIDSSKIKTKNLFVYLDPTEWNLTEVLQKSRGSPLTEEEPKDLVTKKAAIRTNKLGRFFIDISSRRLHEKAKKENIRCLINRKKDILLIKSKELEARKLTPHGKGRIQISIPKEILKEREILALSKKSWLPVWIKLNLNSFGLKLTDFYSVKEERELGEWLIKNNIKIAIKKPSDPYDIYLPENSSCIEVHNSLPSSEDLVTRHRIKAGQVRLRVLEANFFIKNKRLKNFFLIINEKWKEGKYISELTKNLENGVYVLFTNFNRGWGNAICKRIIKLINKI